MSGLNYWFPFLLYFALLSCCYLLCSFSFTLRVAYIARCYATKHLAPTSSVYDSYGMNKKKSNRFFYAKFQNTRKIRWGRASITFLMNINGKQIPRETDLELNGRNEWRTKKKCTMSIAAGLKLKITLSHCCKIHDSLPMFSYWLRSRDWSIDAEQHLVLRKRKKNFFWDAECEFVIFIERNDQFSSHCSDKNIDWSSILTSKSGYGKGHRMELTLICTHAPLTNLRYFDNSENLKVPSHVCYLCISRPRGIDHFN